MRRLWYNGKIASVDPENRVYQALGTEERKIVFLGSTQEAAALPWDEQTDLHGALMLPGFQDSHMHMIHYALHQRNVSLSGVDSIPRAIQICRERIEREHPSYLVAVGWNQEMMREGRLLTREDMDQISTEIPVCAIRACVHIAACNSVMLDRIREIKNAKPDMLAGVDYEKGHLRESAVDFYLDVMPPAGDEEIRRLVRLAQRDLNAGGIVAVHSDDLQSVPGVAPDHVLKVLQDMERNGELTVRIHEQCLVNQAQFPALLALRPAETDHTGMVRLACRKLLEDGSLGAKSAEMIDGYVDEPDNPGIANYTPQELYEMIRDAHAQRLDVACHAIGDLALKKLCDTVERVLREDPWPDHRHGVVHAQTTSPELLERMRALGLQAYIQPIFIDADMEIIAQRVGEAHARDCYQWKTMRNMGIHTSGGSDCPVEPFDILDNIRAAVTRKNRAGNHTYLPEQALTVEEAVRLFTCDAAWSGRDEDVRGTLELGRLADLVVLDRDLFQISPEDFTKTRILETVVGGKTVYRA